VIHHEQKRVAASNPRNLDAWDTMLRGLWHIFKYTKEDTAKARHFAMQAIELDSGLSEAFGLLAASHFVDLSNQWSDSPADSLSAVRHAAKKSAESDPDAPLALTVLGLATAFEGERPRAIEILTRSVEANPSFALGLYALGVAYMLNNQSSEAIPVISRAIRLSPRDPMLHQFLAHLSQANFIEEQFKEASGWAERSLGMRQSPSAYRILAASQGYLGNAEEGRTAIVDLEKLAPEFSPSSLGFGDTPELIERYLEGWRRTGWHG
jgi:adenylate cyclase